ncbi:Ectonucleotide pyrophosphatase/phosphodiesterase C27A7.1 [Aphelenchoides besseyi]|nr:Ectonucleotide pyrophosphatase/phosphodiesterase C27A7.1 [Aphelenchoides besseyi]
MTMVEIPLCSPASTPKIGDRDFAPAETEAVQVRLRDFRVQRKHVFFAVLLAILLVSLGVCIGYIFRLFGNKRQAENPEWLNADQSWQSSCEPRCTANFDVPPLLLISLDGFRVEYLNRDITSAISRVYNCGAHSYMYSSFPTKTFPNHLSIITGLFPESHGIVGTKFIDFNISDLPFSPKTARTEYFHGEPIWNTALHNGKKSATFFWPGSEVLINGKKPTFSINYNSSIPFSKRVDQVIEWLELPDYQRPLFFAMYFEQPDNADSDAMKMSLIVADAMLNYLLSRLDRKGYLGCVNLVLVSDHGMVNIRQDEPVLLDQYFNITDSNIFAASGVVSNIFYKNKTNVDIEKEMQPLKCLKGERFYALTPKTVPKRYHYSKSSRIGDVILESTLGHIIHLNKEEAASLQNVGDHGYDYVNKHMHAIFGATGPSIKRGVSVQPFQNVELYNLFVDLMHLPFSAPTNGTRGLLYNILKDPPEYEDTRLIDLPECFGVSLAKCGDACPFKIQTAPLENAGCIRLDRIQVPESLADTSNLCTVVICNATLVFDRDLKQTKVVETLLIGNPPNIYNRANCTWHLKFGTPQPSNGENPIELPEHLEKQPVGPPESECVKGMQSTTTTNNSWITLFNEDDYSRYIAEGQIYAPQSFVKEIYKEFMNLVSKYRKHYQQLVMFKGPIYDIDYDGVMDEQHQNRERAEPSHVFVILLRCEGEWHKSNRYCLKPETTQVLSFMIPLIEDFNCLFKMEYIFRNTVRIRDIELATGLEFFTDRSIYSSELALRLRTYVVEELWNMKRKP